MTLDGRVQVRQEKGWGTKGEAFMKTITPAEYRAAIDAHTGEDLKLLMLQSIDFCKNRKNYDPHFGAATQSFLDACSDICVDNSRPRLARLIQGLFAGQSSPRTLLLRRRLRGAAPVDGETP